MMLVSRSFLLTWVGTGLWQPTIGAYVWPNDQTDQLETILYEQSGFMSSNILNIIGGCTGAAGRGGRNFGAEWLR